MGRPVGYLTSDNTHKKKKNYWAGVAQNLARNQPGTSVSSKQPTMVLHPLYAGFTITLGWLLNTLHACSMQSHRTPPHPALPLPTPSLAQPSQKKKGPMARFHLKTWEFPVSRLTGPMELVPNAKVTPAPPPSKLATAKSVPLPLIYMMLI